MQNTHSFTRLVKGLTHRRAAVWLWLAIVWLGGSPAANAQFYRPNYLTNAGFDAVTLAQGELLPYGNARQTVDGWSYQDYAGITRRWGHTDNVAFMGARYLPSSSKR